MPGLSTTIYNVSYMYAPDPSPLMATPEVFFFCLITGIVLLLVSVFLPLSLCSDLAAVISSGFLFLSSIYAWAVDTVTAFGATSTITGEPFLMENHIIYHYNFLGVLSAILLVFSFANWYRIWLDYKRITEQEQHQVERMPREPSGMRDVREEDRRENGYSDLKRRDNTRIRP